MILDLGKVVSRRRVVGSGEERDLVERVKGNEERSSRGRHSRVFLRREDNSKLERSEASELGECREGGCLNDRHSEGGQTSSTRKGREVDEARKSIARAKLELVGRSRLGGSVVEQVIASGIPASLRGIGSEKGDYSAS